MSTQYIFAAAGFPLLTVLFVGLLLRVLNNAIMETQWTIEKKKTIRFRIVATLLFWVVAISIASISGATGKWEIFPLNFGPVILIPLVSIVIAVSSKNTTDILQQISPRAIINLQVFRVFVEIVLWMLFIQNLVPLQMTFEGRNFDILTGLTAPIAAYFLPGNRKAMIIWNFLGLALLINIVAIAILSMPTTFQVFTNEPANTIVTKFPFVFLAGFLVPLAYTLHFLSLKQLMSNTVHAKSAKSMR
jgi:hypothetical protein